MAMSRSCPTRALLCDDPAAVKHISSRVHLHQNTAKECISSVTTFRLVSTSKKGKHYFNAKKKSASSSLLGLNIFPGSGDDHTA